jgi:hypothetical protein
MGTYLNIDDDPNEVSGTGAILNSMAQSFRTQAQAALSEIQAIDGERPWASDKYGQAFEAKYTEAADGQPQPVRDAVQERMSHAGETLSTVGRQTVLAMTEYQGSDKQGADEIKQTSV